MIENIDRLILPKIDKVVFKVNNYIFRGDCVLYNL